MNKKNILIVDDSPIAQKQLSNILESAGYNIIGTATNGNDAIKIYSENKDKIDIVTLDITIIGLMDGVNVLKEILKINPKANVIMVSALGKDNIIKECLQSGARHFIQKPFKKDKILETVSYILK